MLYKLFNKYLRREWAESSWGELFDKISILQVKMYRIKGMGIQHLVDQYDYLSKKLNIHMHNTLTKREVFRARNLLEALYKNNYQQWDYENAMSLTGNEISVEDRLQSMKNSYTHNRKRAIIKRSIDNLFNSKFVEIKQYDGMKDKENSNA